MLFLLGHRDSFRASCISRQIFRGTMLRPDKTHRRKPEPSLLLAAGTLPHFRRSPFLRASIFVLLCLAFAPCLRADTISGTVKDPTGAAVVNARIEISGGDVSQPIVLTSDESGKFAAPI